MVRWIAAYTNRERSMCVGVRGIMVVSVACVTSIVTFACQNLIYGRISYWMSKLVKSIRWELGEWQVVEREAARLGIPPSMFVRLFVLSGVAPDGLGAKVKKARRYFGVSEAQPTQEES